MKFLVLVLNINLRFHFHIDWGQKVWSGIFTLCQLSNIATSEFLIIMHMDNHVLLYMVIHTTYIYIYLTYTMRVGKHVSFSGFKRRWLVLFFVLNKKTSCKEYFITSKMLTFPSVYILRTLTLLKQNFSQLKPIQPLLTIYITVGPTQFEIP